MKVGRYPHLILLSMTLVALMWDSSYIIDLYSIHIWCYLIIFVNRMQMKVGRCLHLIFLSGSLVALMWDSCYIIDLYSIHIWCYLIIFVNRMQMKIGRCLHLIFLSGSLVALMWDSSYIIDLSNIHFWWLNLGYPYDVFYVSASLSHRNSSSWLWEEKSAKWIKSTLWIVFGTMWNGYREHF